MADELVGTGLNVGVFQNLAAGTVRYVARPADVVGLMRESTLDSTIVLTQSGSVTFAGALLQKRPAGLLTIEGAPESHLGILSREFGIPAVMSIQLAQNDIVARIGPDGLVTSDYIKQVAALLEGEALDLDCRGDEVGKLFRANSTD